MSSRRERILEAARAAGTLGDEDLRRAEARRAEYVPFGADVPVEVLLAEAGCIAEGDVEEAARGEDLPSRLLGLEVVRLAGGTPEHPVFLARRALDGEVFLLHACMLRRRDAPAEVDAFVKAVERGRRLTGRSWLPVREASLADGAYVAATAVPEGVRLDERIADRGPLTPEEAIALVKRLAEALWPLEAMDAPAAFPDPSLVFVAPDGRPTLVSVEVLLAASGTPGNLPEVARSAARCLARLVGPERVGDPTMRDLMADLTSGRFDAIRPDGTTPLAVAADAPAADASTEVAPTPVGRDSGAPVPLPPRLPPSPPSWPGPARGAVPAAAPVGVPARRRLPVAWMAAAVVAAGAIAYFAVSSGRSAPERAAEGTEGADARRGPEAASTSGPSAGPGREATPGTPAPRDPALVALEEALEFLTVHRAGEPQAVIDRLRGVEARFGGTEAAFRAAARRQQFEKEVEDEAERRSAAIAADVERLLAADEMGAALAAIDAFPRSLSFTVAARRVEALRARAKEKADALYATLRPTIDAGAEPNRQDAARAAFERVRSLGDKDLTQRAEARLAAALERSSAWQAKRRDLEPDLRRVVGEALAAAGAGDPDRARRVLDAAAEGPLSEPFRDRLASARDAVIRAGRAFELAASAARARTGKAVTLAPRDYAAKPFQATVVDVAGDRVSYTRGGVPGTIRLPAVDPEALAALALSDGRDTDAPSVLAVATYLAASGRQVPAETALARAQSLGASTGAFAEEASAARAWLAIAAGREVAAGEVLLERDREGARTAFAHAAAAAPFLPEPHRRLGEMLLADRRPEEALAELRRARTLGGTGPDLLLAIARASASRPDDEVLQAWRAFLAAAPRDDPRAEAARAEAERVASRVVRGSTTEKLKAAKALLDAGKPADAVAAIEEAAAADPVSLDAQRALARAAEKAQDFVKAYLAWRAAHDLAKATRDATEAKEQMDRLERAQGERPAEAFVRKSGEEQSGHGQFAGAVETYRRAVAMAPLDAEARLGLGGALLGLALRTGSKALFEEGVAAYGIVVQIAPDDPRGWAGRAEIRRWRGDFTGAIEDAGKAIAKRRDFSQAYNTRGLAEYSALQFEAALGDMNVVTTLAPLLATPRITRAGIYRALGRYEEAEQDLRAALERNPSEAEKAQIAELQKQIATLKKADRK